MAPSLIRPSPILQMDLTKVNPREGENGVNGISIKSIYARAVIIVIRLVIFIDK